MWALHVSFWHVRIRLPKPVIVFAIPRIVRLVRLYITESAFARPPPALVT